MVWRVVAVCVLTTTVLVAGDEPAAAKAGSPSADKSLHGRRRCDVCRAISLEATRVAGTVAAAAAAPWPKPAAVHALSPDAAFMERAAAYTVSAPHYARAAAVHTAAKWLPYVESVLAIAGGTPQMATAAGAEPSPAVAWAARHGGVVLRSLGDTAMDFQADPKRAVSSLWGAVTSVFGDDDADDDDDDEATNGSAEKASKKPQAAQPKATPSEKEEGASTPSGPTQRRVTADALLAEIAPGSDAPQCAGSDAAGRMASWLGSSSVFTHDPRRLGRLAKNGTAVMARPLMLAPEAMSELFRLYEWPVGDGAVLPFRGPKAPLPPGLFSEPLCAAEVALLPRALVPPRCFRSTEESVAAASGTGDVTPAALARYLRLEAATAAVAALMADQAAATDEAWDAAHRAAVRRAAPAAEAAKKATAQQAQKAAAEDDEEDILLDSLPPMPAAFSARAAAAWPMAAIDAVCGAGPKATCEVSQQADMVHPEDDAATPQLAEVVDVARAQVSCAAAAYLSARWVYLEEPLQ